MFPGIDAPPTNQIEYKRYIKAISFLGWPEQRAIGHLVKWYGAPRGVGTASAFAGINARQAKNAVDDVECRIEIVDTILHGRELDPNFYKDIEDPIRFVNGLENSDDVAESWMTAKKAISELNRRAL